MGKQFRKEHPKKKSKYQCQCERCGNDSISRSEVFKCRYCGYINGVESEVEITRGGLDE